MDFEIKEKYSAEIQGMQNIMDRLKKNRYYEKSKVKSDGYLEGHLDKLQELFCDLINKIQNNLPSKKELLQQSKDDYKF